MKRFMFTELCKKEVICDGDGKKLGYPTDIEIDKCGNVQYLSVPRKCSFWFFGPRQCIRVPWCDVTRIGIDVIWVCGKEGSYCKKE